VNGELAEPASDVARIHAAYSAVTVMSGGTLTGTGTVQRAVVAERGGTVCPGGVNGELAVREFDLRSGATLAIDGEGASHGRLAVTDGVSLAGGLDISGLGRLGLGTHTIIRNDSGRAVTGGFSNCPQGGDRLEIESGAYVISYTGGSGFDVTLTFAPEGTVLWVK
jgi:hypothetical protein